MKGETAYKQHVAKQPHPERHKPWGELPEKTQANFAAREKSAPKTVKKVAKKKVAKKK